MKLLKPEELKNTEYQVEDEIKDIIHTRLNGFLISHKGKLCELNVSDNLCISDDYKRYVYDILEAEGYKVEWTTKTIKYTTGLIFKEDEEYTKKIIKIDLTDYADDEKE